MLYRQKEKILELKETLFLFFEVRALSSVSDVDCDSLERKKSLELFFLTELQSCAKSENGKLRVSLQTADAGTDSDAVINKALLAVRRGLFWDYIAQLRFIHTTCNNRVHPNATLCALALITSAVRHVATFVLNRRSSTSNLHF